MHLRIALEVAQQERGVKLAPGLEQGASMQQQGVGQLWWYFDAQERPHPVLHISFEVVPSPKDVP
jgi:hypothetical protein